MKDNHVLIDTDAGTDDAVAIWLLIRAHQDPTSNINVIGISCVNGNTAVENVVTNVSRILRAAGEHGKIPVFRGASHPILEPFIHQVEPFHGENGFGDVDSELEPIDPIISKENGVLAMIRLIHELEGKLTLVALGPLTNLALAVRMDDSIRNKVRAVYSMGGNMEGEGNATISAEFNFAIDPEAAFITLSAFSCPIIIAPWEACKREATSHEWRTQVLGKVDSPQIALLNKVEEKILQKYTDIWIPCDQLIAAALVEPKVMKESKKLHCTLELQGKHSRGLLLLDHMNLLKREANVELITNFDTELHLKLLIWAVGGPHYIDKQLT